MTNSVALYVPHLLATSGIDTANSLGIFLAKAAKSASKIGEVLDFAAFFSSKTSLPAAPLLAALSGPVSESTIYCLVSPVDCYADQHTVYVAKKTTPLLEAQEISLLKMLNDFLVQDNITLQRVGNGLWLFEMLHHTEIHFHDVNSLIGKSMSTVLPTGKDAVYWRKVLTECQMLLSQHTLNLGGHHTSIWFWGNGRYSGALESAFNAVITDDLLLRAMAGSAKIPVKPLSMGWDNTLLDVANNVLIADLSFHQQSCVDIKLFEQQWLTPLLNAVKAGKISTLRLLVGNHVEYCLKRRHLYYFWRTNKEIEFIR